MQNQINHLSISRANIINKNATFISREITDASINSVVIEKCKHSIEIEKNSRIAFISPGDEDVFKDFDPLDLTLRNHKIRLQRRR